MGGVEGTFLDGFLDDPELDGVCDRLRAGRLGASLDQAGDAGLDEVVLPTPDARLRNPHRTHDRHDAEAFGRHQHDLGPLDDLLPRVAIGHNPLKVGAIPPGEHDFSLFLAHSATESCSWLLWIQMSVTEH